MPGRWQRRRLKTETKASADSALLAGIGNLMGSVQTRFEGAGEGQRFGLTAEGHGVLVETNLPLGLCHFFYQDLHC